METDTKRFLGVPAVALAVGLLAGLATGSELVGHVVFVLLVCCGGVALGVMGFVDGIRTMLQWRREDRLDRAGIE